MIFIQMICEGLDQDKDTKRRVRQEEQYGGTYAAVKSWSGRITTVTGNWSEERRQSRSGTLGQPLAFHGEIKYQKFRDKLRNYREFVSDAV